MRESFLLFAAVVHLMQTQSRQSVGLPTVQAHNSRKHFYCDVLVFICSND